MRGAVLLNDDPDLARLFKLQLGLSCLFIHHRDVASAIETAHHQAIDETHQRLQQSQNANPT